MKRPRQIEKVVKSVEKSSLKTSRLSSCFSGQMRFASVSSFAHKSDLFKALDPCFIRLLAPAPQRSEAELRDPCAIGSMLW